MRITSMLSLLILTPLMALAQAQTAEDLRAQDMKKYTLSRGEISYAITGDAKGEEVMIFDQYGWKGMRMQTMIFELYGIQTIQTLHEITDGDWVYRLNPGDSTYVSRKDYKWSQQASYKTPEQASEAILFSLGGIHASDSTLLDRTCEVWTFDGKALQELWIWNGLVLKRKVKLGDRIIFTTANKVELDVATEPETFLIPDYYTKEIPE